LLGWAEERACQEIDSVGPDLRFTTHVNTYRGLEGPQRLFEAMGYHHIRSTHLMEIEMDAAPPEPVWPEGIRVRTFDLERELEAVYHAEIDAFRDHFGFVEKPFEAGFRHWKHHKTNYEDFDPGLWFLAVDGNEIAGISLCRATSPDGLELGWVRSLGVRRPWRKRGLGLALLQHSLGEFYRRGQQEVGLGVDAESLTGALRLYEKAGMHVRQTDDRYEKEIRPGREISVQSLSE
jgi:ribosomal protein S18 acetylase RimI-like enzyme